VPCWERSFSIALVLLLVLLGLAAVFAPLHRALHHEDECSAPACVLGTLSQGLLDAPDSKPLMLATGRLRPYGNIITEFRLPGRLCFLLPPGRAPPGLPVCS